VADSPAAFIFDMDGTLADSMPFHVRTWTTLLAERGVRVSPEAFLRQTSGKTNPQIVEEILGIRMSAEELAAFEAHKEGQFRELYRPFLGPIAGLTEFLEASRAQGVAMGVATSACRANRDFILGGLGLESYFSAVVGVEDIRRSKPHPEIFLATSKRLGVPPGRCVIFEDAQVGLEAARRAGMRAVALTTSLSPAEIENLPGVIAAAPDYTRLDPALLLATLGEPPA
jgi:beta-phosphoglucomutase family hydrolase